ncbi:MAG: 2-succinyl-5-enolpyruvyl-6-hydroxy-3-cyclohexene-1-carboxylate synthase [Bacteroidia bacterium]|jgi:2-succinyl-5-enolpyruvyl-6-hydroxy-3-cyclohexene-1-carboxylate synthase
MASKDALGANLDRGQVIKGWLAIVGGCGSYHSGALLVFADLVQPLTLVLINEDASIFLILIARVAQKSQSRRPQKSPAN